MEVGKGGRMGDICNSVQKRENYTSKSSVQASLRTSAPNVLLNNPKSLLKCRFSFRDLEKAQVSEFLISSPLLQLLLLCGAPIHLHGNGPEEKEVEGAQRA